MRYLCFTEYVADDELFKAMDETSVVRETQPDRFPKQLFPDHEILGDLPRPIENYPNAKIAFTVYETDDPKQLENIVVFWESHTELKVFKRHFVPITDIMPVYTALKEKLKTNKKIGKGGE